MKYVAKPSKTIQGLVNCLQSLKNNLNLRIKNRACHGGIRCNGKCLNSGQNIRKITDIHYMYSTVYSTGISVFFTLLALSKDLKNSERYSASEVQDRNSLRVLCCGLTEVKIYCQWSNRRNCTERSLPSAVCIIFIVQLLHSIQDTILVN